MKRRTFVKLALSAVALSPVERLAFALPPPALPDPALVTLRALAPIVLPKAIGRRNVEATTAGFLAWLEGYRAGVPTEHGYGNPRFRRTPESPAARYVTQLAALEQAAEEQHHQPFSRLAPDAKRSLIEEAFTHAKIENLPNRPNGQHVAADLMAFYFGSSEANDFCYQAQIGRETCRPIAQVTTRPGPLAR
jgi:hypothetical protein